MKVTLGALRSLLSISREHPGDLRANLRSPTPRAAVETFLDIYSNPGLTWEQLATLRERTSLPFLVKGVLHPDDARRAVEVGASGIVVSNHGGRQVDGAIASLDALPGRPGGRRARAAARPRQRRPHGQRRRQGDRARRRRRGDRTALHLRPGAGRDATGCGTCWPTSWPSSTSRWACPGSGSMAEIGPELLAAAP